MEKNALTEKLNRVDMAPSSTGHKRTANSEHIISG